MEHEIKIVTDGETAKVWLDGKKIRCDYLDIRASAENQKPYIRAEICWQKENSNGLPYAIANRELAREMLVIGGRNG